MLILASTSATRRAMLENAGLSFRSERPRVEEARLISENPKWTPEETSLYLAVAKAIEVSERFAGATVIGADQVLALGKRIYSKPADIEDARAQLSGLRNKEHHLISAVACAMNGKLTWHATDSAALVMRDFTDEFLDSYLAANGERTLKSVGGYQIEGLGIQLFETVKGNHYTILGLPLLPLLSNLRSAGEIPS